MCNRKAKPMSDKSIISDSEWIVMKALRRAHPSSGNELIKVLGESTTWKGKTVKTLLNRLVQKGAIGYEKRGREYFYSPLISERECKRNETSSFLKRVFDGALKPALMAFMESEDLSSADIEELKRMLDQKNCG